jgi:hypothetical protein
LLLFETIFFYKKISTLLKIIQLMWEAAAKGSKVDLTKMENLLRSKIDWSIMKKIWGTLGMPPIEAPLWTPNCKIETNVTN